MRPEVVAFDAFGTLFDLEALRPQTTAVAAERGDELFDAFSARLVPLTWHATVSGSYRPLPEIAATAFESAARQVGVRLDRSRAEALAGELGSLPPYPDAGSALAALHGRARLAVLSNGTRSGLERLVAAGGIAGEFERLLVADDVGRFKPAPEVYGLVVEAFGVTPAAVALVSGNEWDVAGAKLAGLRGIWIARGRTPTGFLGVEPDATADELADLPAALDGLERAGEPG